VLLPTLKIGVLSLRLVVMRRTLNLFEQNAGQVAHSEKHDGDHDEELRSRAATEKKVIASLSTLRGALPFAVAT
jgi:hypothetical protein